MHYNSRFTFSKIHTVPRRFQDECTNTKFIRFSDRAAVEYKTIIFFQGLSGGSKLDGQTNLINKNVHNF